MQNACPPQSSSTADGVDTAGTAMGAARVRGGRVGSGWEASAGDAISYGTATALETRVRLELRSEHVR